MMCEKALRPNEECIGCKYLTVYWPSTEYAQYFCRNKDHKND